MNFRKLKLMKLPSYEIPLDMIKIENRKSSEKCVSTLQNWKNDLSDNRMNESKYIEAYKTMIYFEEASEARILEQFNQKNIRIKFTGERGKYYIRIDVNVNFILIK